MEWLATQCIGNTKSGDIRVWGSKDSHRTSGEVIVGELKILNQLELTTSQVFSSEVRNFRIRKGGYKSTKSYPVEICWVE